MPSKLIGRKIKQDNSGPGILTGSKFKHSRDQRNTYAGRKITNQVWIGPDQPTWTRLPDDITINILQRLGAVEILETARKVCRTWRRVCKDPAMWRVIDMHPGDGNHYNIDLDEMCRHAVDRSQGQLVDIYLEDIDSVNELLDYIGARCGNLRRLQLAYCCGGLNDSAQLHKAIERFPKLEELHIVGTSVSKGIIETIGRFCPLLTSFTLNFPRLEDAAHDIRSPPDGNAMAIASSMSGLRRLQLLNNCRLTNQGLEAILDGCPHLESLDLRGCRKIELRGNVWNRCSTQIKYLRYPMESISGYEYNSNGGHNTDLSVLDSNYDNDSVSDSDPDIDLVSGSDYADLSVFDANYVTELVSDSDSDSDVHLVSGSSFNWF